MRVSNRNPRWEELLRQQPLYCDNIRQAHSGKLSQKAMITIINNYIFINICR